MELNTEEVIEWIARTRKAQGLSGTVTLDPALHARTVAAVERAQQQEEGSTGAGCMNAALALRLRTRLETRC
jgi:hypothetical protein